MEIGDSLKCWVYAVAKRHPLLSVTPSSYKPDVASLCYVAQIYVKNEAL